MFRALSMSFAAAALAAAGCSTTQAPEVAGAAPAPNAAATTAALPPQAVATLGAPAAQPPGVASTPISAPASTPAAIAVPAYGIEILDTRLSAAGSMVDLRYRVLDPDKAAPLLDRKVRPVLVHVDTGKRYYVPQPPIVGSLRQTVRGGNTPQPGRTYFMLFANPNRALKSGDTLALFVGEHRVGEFRIPQ